MLDSLSDSVESYSNTAVKRIEKFLAAVLGRNLSLMPFSVAVSTFLVFITNTLFPHVLHTWQVSPQAGGTDCGIHMLHNIDLIIIFIRTRLTVIHPQHYPRVLRTYESCNTSLFRKSLLEFCYKKSSEHLYLPVSRKDCTCIFYFKFKY